MVLRVPPLFTGIESVSVSDWYCESPLFTGIESVSVSD